ncbi:MAG: FAD-binding domain-containing protein [Fimbriiglobus sp.]
MKNDRDTPRAAILGRLHGCFFGDPRPGTIPGGRTAGLARLRAYDPASYGRTRNHLDAAVSRLSPYLRHGMISAVEVRDHVKAAFPNDPGRLEEFLRQLAWRDFFENVLAWHGRGLDDDLEEPKHAVARSARLPLDVAAGDTGLPCVDGMLGDLFADGYLHNHARLWFAAYLCHFRGVRWQAGARLFRQFLYDGDVASNSASWQWVEGTFAAKPYFMNKQNVATFSGGRWCDTCTTKCPFDAEYPTLQHRLFGGSMAPFAVRSTDSGAGSDDPASAPIPDQIGPVPPATDLVWVHDAALSWDDPAVKANPAAAVAFVFDEPALRAEPWAYHRIAFVLDGLDDLFAHLPNPTRVTLVGDPAERLAALGRRTGATTIHVSGHPNPWVAETAEGLRSDFRVVVHPRPAFAEYPDEPKRFSRYWDKVAPQVLGCRPKSSKRMHQ